MRSHSRWLQCSASNALVAGLGLLLAALVAGCSGGPSASQITPWRDGINAVREQSDAAFAATNLLARDNQLAYAITQPTLQEQLFRPALDGESIRRWDGALDVLSSYAAGVATLVDTSNATKTGTIAASLAEQIAMQARSTLFQARPGLSSAIAKVGEALARAQAQSQAQAILADADPAVQELLAALRETIAQSDAEGTTTGVIATVSANWGLRLAELQARYLEPGADRAEIASTYADALARRDAAISTLVGVQRSLDSLALAHAQLARGQVVDTTTLLAQIREYAALARDVLKDLQPAPQ